MDIPEVFMMSKLPVRPTDSIGAISQGWPQLGNEHFAEMPARQWIYSLGATYQRHTKCWANDWATKRDHYAVETCG